MRLLNALTLKLEEHSDSALPDYVILSHTWDKDEVTFEDMKAGRETDKAGLQKIKGCCKRAEREGFLYVWIDTCCIDKSSSAELSEAINSMYTWYKNAAVCYAFLSDVPPAFDDLLFRKSKWFNRGWTLQELIAPPIVEFYANNWGEIGTKLSLQSLLSDITGIDLKVLGGAHPSICTVAERMSWASKRQTTRVEDIAYCLLGLFDINMPLLYGEGSRAFIRLQEEILRTSGDYTIFAWRAQDLEIQKSGLLAHSPSEFRKSDRITRQFDAIREPDTLKLLGHLRAESSKSQPPDVTGWGLRLSIPIWETDSSSCLAWLLCYTKNGSFVCIRLEKSNTSPPIYWRKQAHKLEIVRQNSEIITSLIQDIDERKTVAWQTILAHRSMRAVVGHHTLNRVRTKFPQDAEIFHAWPEPKSETGTGPKYVNIWDEQVSPGAFLALVPRASEFQTNVLDAVIIIFGLVKLAPWCKMFHEGELLSLFADKGIEDAPTDELELRMFMIDKPQKFLDNVKMLLKADSDLTGVNDRDSKELQQSFWGHRWLHASMKRTSSAQEGGTADYKLFDLRVEFSNNAKRGAWLAALGGANAGLLDLSAHEDDFGLGVLGEDVSEADSTSQLSESVTYVSL